MDEMRDILGYLLKEYPHPKELSNARVTKMTYLADWRHAIRHGHQITKIKWFFDNYGPYVSDVKYAVLMNPDLFSCTETVNSYGDSKRLFSLVNREFTPELSDEVRTTLEHVINTTKDLNWEEFIKLIYSTYPILSSERYSYLDLGELAEDYALPIA